MKVTFRTNLGSIDAKPLELDHTKCTVGRTIDVKKEVGEELVKRGIAETADKAEDDAIVQSALEEQERLEPSSTTRAVAKEPDVKGFKNNPHSPAKPE